ncbi:MAG TPA: preprotein translocase subunit YajC [Gaiellaceae bacterium]|nr:preprotein translocase subunit YajC [Gaiellaceae bacterium]
MNGGTLILLAAMFALLWVLLIRPQKRKQAEQQQLLASIEPGDEVLTVGGIYGIVQEIDEDDELIVEIAEGIRVRIARRAIAGVEKPDDEPDEADEDDDLEEEDAVEVVNDEDGVVVSEEIVKSEVPEGAEALDRR